MPFCACIPLKNILIKKFDKLNETIKLNKRKKLTEGDKFLVAEPELTAA